MPTSSRRLFAGFVGLALAGLLFATALPASAQEYPIDDPIDEPAPGQELLVTFLIYSGQPNPTILVTDPQQIADLQSRIANAQAWGTPVAGEGPEPVLGYNGVMIENQATTYDESSTFYVIKNDTLRVDGGNPDDPYARSTTVSGEATALENVLISLGVQSGVITEAAMAEIREPNPYT